MYLLNHLSDEYAQPYSQEETILNQIDEVLLCKSLIETWETPHLSWYIDDGDKCCDFPFMYGFIPIVNQRAYKVIKDLIPSDEVEFLPLFIEDEQYYLLNLLIQKENIINIKKSKVKYYSDGRIMGISDFVFNQAEITSTIFRVSESKTSVFVNEIIKQAIEKHKLIGANFVKCKVVKPSFFDKLF